jgi:hypothetical protein
MSFYMLFKLGPGKGPHIVFNFKYLSLFESVADPPQPPGRFG